MTDYRDGVIHNAPTDFGLGTGSMQKLDGGVWSVLMRIRDDPEVKSRAAFTFANGLDALTYGWELTNEIVRVATAIMKAIPGARRGRHVAAGNRSDLTFRPWDRPPVPPRARRRRDPGRDALPANRLASGGEAPAVTDAGLTPRSCARRSD